ncbi:MAG: 3-methylcrotonyl-CoA carboxylase beta subunit, partial [Acidimicrobiales bacterium]
MNRITSKIDVGSAEFAENRDTYVAELVTLTERQQWVIDGGERRQRSIERHLDRGKIMVRDRIDLVTDDNTSFLEFSTLSAYGQYDNEAPGAGIVTGIGIVHGVPWVFIA